MSNSKYKKFLREYEKLANEVNNEALPIKATKLVENNLPRLNILFEECLPYFMSFDDLELEEMRAKRNQVNSELYNIIEILRSKESEIRHSEFHNDHKMIEIINSFEIFKWRLSDIFTSIPTYISTNDDYLLLMEDFKKRREHSHKNYNGNNDYRGIVFKNDEFRNAFYELIRQRVAATNSYVLLQLLNGKQIEGKITFTGKVELFIYYFNKPYVNNLIISDRETLIDWLLDNFKTFSRTDTKELNSNTLRKKFLPHDHQLKEYEDSKKHFNEVKNLVNSFL